MPLMADPRRYRFAPGVDVVALDNQRFQFRSDFVAMQMSGQAAADFVQRGLANLDQARSLDSIAALMPGYRPESIGLQLDALVDAGVLVVGVGARDEERRDNRPFRHLLDEIGLDAGPTMERLATQTVAIFELEAHGAHLAVMLADAGVGTLVLVDPYPFNAAHRYLTPVSAPSEGDTSRQDAVANHIRREGLRIELPAVGGTFDKKLVADIVGRSDLSISCWDRGMSAANHWVNEAAVASNTPTLFGELRATSSFAGPFVFPSRSACLMCYRMRSLACEADFESAMAYEEHLDRQRRPSLADRPILPILPNHLSSILGLEALKYLIRLNQPRLVDRVVEFDALQIETQSHPVLVEPGCPVCGKKNSAFIPTARNSVEKSATLSR